jgi:hypothetical protein
MLPIDRSDSSAGRPTSIFSRSVKDRQRPLRLRPRRGRTPLAAVKGTTRRRESPPRIATRLTPITAQKLICTQRCHINLPTDLGLFAAKLGAGVEGAGVTRRAGMSRDGSCDSPIESNTRLAACASLGRSTSVHIGDLHAMLKPNCTRDETLTVQTLLRIPSDQASDSLHQYSRTEHRRPGNRPVPRLD